VQEAPVLVLTVESIMAAIAALPASKRNELFARLPDATPRA
jgi:hypothetical protein